MDLKKDWKRTSHVFLGVLIIYFVGLIIFKPCEWTETPMKCTWYSIALKCMYVPLFANGIWIYKSKSLESKKYACFQNMLLCLSIIFASVFIGVCSGGYDGLFCIPEGMICSKLEIMALAISCILILINLIQLYIIAQMKKYELEDSDDSSDSSKLP